MRSGSFNLCLMTETYHPVTGGGETQARNLAEGLASQGVDVCLITRRSDRELATREAAGKVSVHRVPPAGPGHLRKWGMLVTAAVELVRLRKHYDVILVCGFRVLAVPALVAGGLLGKPCVLKADSQGELSGAFFDPGLARFGLRHDRFPANLAIRLRNALFRRATRFVAISGVIEQEYRSAGVAAGRIARIPNSTDPDLFRPLDRRERQALRQRLDLAEDRAIVTFTGRLVTTKGLPSLLRAWRKVIAARPDALLLLVGSGGLGLQNCEAALRHYTKEHDLGSAVRFAGSVDNVHEYLQASDVFVLPTEREAFGISIIEAMACALPVVTTAVDGVRDVVRPGIDALVVAPGDDDGLAKALTTALESGPAIVEMARTARERAVREYSNGSVVAAYRHLLAEVLG